ncbi:hypothetical protein D918_09351 [Trichuris suis]|nr:hypothetical protein D918_09351 [Trichuris suis]
MRTGTRERSNLSAERCHGTQGQSRFPGKWHARAVNDQRSVTGIKMHVVQNGIDKASCKGLSPVPGRLTGTGMINGFMPPYPTTERLHFTIGRRTSAASEMSPLKRISRDKPFEGDYGAAVKCRKPEYKYTPFKRGLRGAPMGAEQNDKSTDHGGSYGKPTGNDSERETDKICHIRSEVEDGHTISGRGTPNSLAAAWRNSHTLHRSVGDITAESGIQPYQHITVKPQSAQISPPSVKRLPLSLPHVPPGYAPFTMCNPTNAPSRPWSTCGFPPPWPIDLPCNNHVESSIAAKVKPAAEKATEEPPAEVKPFWKPLLMIAVLQLVLGMAILITGIIRIILKAYMAIGFDVFIGLYVTIVQGIIVTAIRKNNWCLMTGGYTASVVQCNLLGLPIFASFQSLQKADVNTAAHQYAVDIFIVTLCLCDLALLAISLSYSCFVVVGNLRISQKESTGECRCRASLNELQLSKKRQESSEGTK